MSDHRLEHYNRNRYEGEKSNDQESDWLFDMTAMNVPASDTDEAWNKLSVKLSSSKKKSNTPLLLKIAASIILLFACYFVFDIVQKNDLKLQTISSLDEVRTVTFPDGSVAILNKDTKVSFSESFDDVREVEFVGEAYFDIVKDSRPFVIKAGEVHVRVLGTAFNLDNKDNQLAVLVDHGLVAIEKGEQQIKVSKGQLGLFDKKTLEVSLDTTPPTNLMSWRNGKFTFENTPLYVAAKQLSAYYEVEFKLVEKIKDCKITANFDNSTLKEVISVLEGILDANVTQNKSEVLIKGKGCK